MGKNIITSLSFLKNKDMDYVPTSKEAKDIIKALFEEYKDET